MNVLIILIALQLHTASGQTWASRARLSNFSTYFRETLGQVVLELEKKEWCNLKVDNITGVINEHMYNWHVTGDVTYANGFLISIQKIDLSNIQDLVNNRAINGTTQAIGTVRGFLNFRDVNVGFDVIFQLEDGSTQWYTGVFTYSLINFQCTIEKNLNTGAITAFVHNDKLDSGAPRMIYLPANNVTEVLSRRFTPWSISRSVQKWGRDIIEPILNNFVTLKMEFPDVCFVNC